MSIANWCVKTIPNARIVKKEYLAATLLEALKYQHFLEDKWYYDTFYVWWKACEDLQTHLSGKFVITKFPQYNAKDHFQA